MTGRGSGSAIVPPTGTVTFLFSDVEGSERSDQDHAAMQAAVRLHDQLMREAIAASGGLVFKTVGDAFCTAFSSPKAAAQAAIDAQRSLGSADFSAVGGLRVRMAINTGTADERDGDYFGPTVNRVARLLSIGHGGQVLLSSIAAGLVRENPPPEATTADLGEHTLKDIEGHERVYQLVAPDLQGRFPGLRTQKKSEAWLVPDAIRTRYFTGRNHLLAQLRGQLQERHRAALSGLGGVGKTQAAVEYALRYRPEYPSGAFWIDAEKASGLTSGFVEIAKTLGLPAAASDDQEQVVKAVLEWLNGADRWLLIFDNVEDRREVRRFVPEHGKGDILITSRESVFAELGIPRALEVRDFDVDEAVQFLLARTGREDSEPAERTFATELAAELGHLPLALEQAAAYVTETNAGFSDYLSAFRKRRVSLLEKAGGLVSRDTVAITWAANFAAVEGISPGAAAALRTSAFLAPDAIPFEILSKGAQALGGPIAEALDDPDDLAVAELLQPLARYSLVRIDAGSRALGVHRLVQEVVRAAIGETERRAFVEAAVGALSAAFPDVAYANWAQCDRLVPHVVSIVGWLQSYDVSPGNGSRMLIQTGSYLRERGRYREAEQHLKRVLALVERALGPERLEVAMGLNRLGTVYWDQGRYSEARPLHERALTIRERALGPDHPDVAVSLNNLAVVDLDQGRYTVAAPLFERALAIWERALGPDDSHVALCLGNLAMIALGQGRYAEAEPLYRRSFAIQERALGPGHPQVAFALSNLAEILWKRGKTSEAQLLHERALAIRENALGLDHSDVAYSLDGLASVRVMQGRYAEAQALLERSLAIRERALGPDHEHAAYSLDGLAGVHLEQGRNSAAEPLYQRALALRERALGPHHPDVATSLLGLASLRKEQGRRDEALALYERALAIKERTFAADHPEVAEIRETLDALRGAHGVDRSSVDGS